MVCSKREGGAIFARTRQRKSLGSSGEGKGKAKSTSFFFASKSVCLGGKVALTLFPRAGCKKVCPGKNLRGQQNRAKVKVWGGLREGKTDYSFCERKKNLTRKAFTVALIKWTFFFWGLVGKLEERICNHSSYLKDFTSSFGFYKICIVFIEIS